MPSAVHNDNSRIVGQQFVWGRTSIHLPERLWIVAVIINLGMCTGGTSIASWPFHTIAEMLSTLSAELLLAKIYLCFLLCPHERFEINPPTIPTMSGWRLSFIPVCGQGFFASVTCFISIRYLWRSEGYVIDKELYIPSNYLVFWKIALSPLLQLRETRSRSPWARYPKLRLSASCKSWF